MVLVLNNHFHLVLRYYYREVKIVYSLFSEAIVGIGQASLENG